MGVPVFVAGFSGNGKSYSMKNLDADKVHVIECAGKRLPFKTRIKPTDLERVRADLPSFDPYQYMMAGMKSSDKRMFVIDDSQYLMSFEEMDSDLGGYDKFNSIGFNFVGLMRFIRNQLPDESIVYLLHHVEYDEKGGLKLKTIGKLIDNHFTLEGLVDIILYAHIVDGKHVFEHTPKRDGELCKNGGVEFPEDPMPNDLAVVDAVIRDFYDFSPLESEVNDEGGDD